MNEKRVVLKRKYTDNHPAHKTNFKSPIRNSVLNFVKDSGGVVEYNEFKEFINRFNEWEGRKTTMSNVKKNYVGRFLKEFNKDGRKHYKLTKLGERVLERTKVNESVLEKYEEKINELNDVDKKYTLDILKGSGFVSDEEIKGLADILDVDAKDLEVLAIKDEVVSEDVNVKVPSFEEYLNEGVKIESELNEGIGGKFGGIFQRTKTGFVIPIAIWSEQTHKKISLYDYSEKYKSLYPEKDIYHSIFKDINDLNAYLTFNMKTYNRHS